MDLQRDQMDRHGRGAAAPAAPPALLFDPTSASSSSMMATWTCSPNGWWSVVARTARHGGRPRDQAGRARRPQPVIVCCGIGRGGQDHHRSGDRDGGRPGRSPSGRGHDRPGQAPGRRARPGGHRATRRAPSTGSPVVGRRAVGDDAGHQGDVRRPRQRYSADPAQATRILDNRFYKNISGCTLGHPGVHGDRRSSTSSRREGFDIVVVDTPPSRNALDFFDAPRRLTHFLDHRCTGCSWPRRVGS